MTYFPGVYTKLKNYMKWVYEVTRDSMYCSSFEIEATRTRDKSKKNNQNKIKKKRNNNKKN